MAGQLLKSWRSTQIRALAKCDLHPEPQGQGAEDKTLTLAQRKHFLARDALYFITLDVDVFRLLKQELPDTLQAALIKLTDTLRRDDKPKAVGAAQAYNR